MTAKKQQGTSKKDPAKAKLVVAAYCPFCGEKLR